MGILPSCLIAGWLIDVIGRKKLLLGAGVTLAIPWIMIIFATNIGVLYAARFMSGMGVGFLIVVSIIISYHTWKEL